jgi:hypothetical protein
MKKKIVFSLLLITSLYACKKDTKEPKQVVPTNPQEQFTENSYVRIMLTDADNSNLYLVNGKTYNVQTLPFSYSGARVYNTSSGRYAGVVSGSGNFVRFFDSGIQHNGSSVSESTAQWALTTATSPSPVHFYSRDNHTVLFNDGDGSLSLFKEDELYSRPTAINLTAGNTAHHGAPAIFNNGKIAITHKDLVAPINGVLPEYVKVIEMDGTEVHAKDIKTGGIHGEACNGTTAIFGSTNGILKVSDNGTQTLIPYPASFGTTWLGSLIYGKESQVFIGFRRGFGVFKVDITSNTISTIDNSTDFNGVTFDEKGKYLIVLHKTGKLRVIDPSSGAILNETSSVVGFPSSGNSYMPILKSTSKIVYVIDATNQKILTYKKSDLSFIKEVALPGKPLTASIIGFDGE